jgi:hypothetical protein
VVLVAVTDRRVERPEVVQSGETFEIAGGIAAGDDVFHKVFHNPCWNRGGCSGDLT